MPDLSLEKLLPFLLVILPGIVTLRVFHAFYPPEKRNIGSILCEVAIFGVFNAVLWIPLTLFLVGQGAFATGFLPWFLHFAEYQPTWCGVLSIAFLFVGPVLLALLCVWLRECRFVTARIGYPTTTAWDDFFKQGRACWILFHLKSGRMLGGYFGGESYASSFPIPPEVYVEEVWRVNERGEFVEKVAGTMGMVIRSDECERLEFLCVEVEQATPPEHGKDQAPCPSPASNPLVMDNGEPSKPVASSKA